MATRDVVIEIRGMTCGGCVRAVGNVLGRMPGVRASDVAVGTARVSFDEGEVSEADLRAAIDRAGFETASIAPG